MKKIKKLTSIFTILAMTFMMMIGVNASIEAGTALTLTLDAGSHNVSGVNFKIYRLLYVSGTEDAAIYKINPQYADFFVKDDSTKMTDEEAYQYVKDNITKSDFTTKLRAFVGAHSNLLIGTITGTDVRMYTKGLENTGYYAILPDKEDLFMPNYTTLIKDKTIYVKGTKPSTDKKVDNADWATAQIGQKVTFTVNSIIPNLTGVKTASFELTDTMDSGLTLSTDVADISVAVGGNKIDASKYTVETSGQTLKIKINDIFDFKDNPGESIVFTYKATINEAAVNVDSVANKAVISYTHDATVDESQDIVNTYSIDLTVHKVDDNNKPLAGAEFKFYQVLTDYNYQLTFIKLSDGVYRIATAAELKEGKAVDRVVSPADGTIVIKGLSATNYLLEEVKTPDGYTIKDKNTNVVIEAVSNDGGTTIDITGNETTVVNYAGTLLPETGGTGTTVFTIIGVAGLTAVGATFFTKKRKNLVK